MPLPNKNSRIHSSRRFGVLLATILVAAPLLGIASEPPTTQNNLTGRWGLGFEAGLMKLVEGEWDYSTVNEFGGLSLSKGLSAQWNLTLALQYGHVRPGADFPGDEVGLSGSSSAPLYTTIFQPAVKLTHRFAPAKRFSPTLGVGLGLTKWRVLDKSGEDVGWFPSGDAVDGFDTDGEATALEGTDFTILLELGLDISLTGDLFLNVGGRYEIMPGNKADNIGLGMNGAWGRDHVDANTGMVQTYIGLTWWLGSGDRDHDGISDEDDLCPDQPEDFDGFNDLDGCPEPDNDDDGVLDADDACPNLAEDRDGFQDDDGCPDPDNDRDGIVDGRDACPDEAEDIDGWDDQDGCPEWDNDQDGVVDSEDRCPRTPADSKVDADGCAIEVPTAAETTVFVPAATSDTVLEGVNFLTGSAELTGESISTLIDLAATLRYQPELRIEIRGHTDAAGGAETNRQLSQRRAESVRATLIDMGIEANRLTAVGYGEDSPIADNGTAEGRRLNRRVEIHPL